MQIYTKFGDLAFKEFTFPDGQPHFVLQTKDDAKEVTIEAAIRNPAELFGVVLAHDVLNNHYDEVNLDIRYLMAARMDRRIDKDQPFTLNRVSYLLEGFNRIRILDPHSDISIGLLNAGTVLPFAAVSQVLATLGGDTTVVIPDKGAIERSRLLGKGAAAFAQMVKERCPQDGNILSMKLVEGEAANVYNRRCLIIDDICDGGATFIKAAAILKDAGAAEIFLYVTHGIFSKKLPLPGIKNIFVTDSFARWQNVPHCSLVCIPVSMRNLP